MLKSFDRGDDDGPHRRLDSVVADAWSNVEALRGSDAIALLVEVDQCARRDAARKARLARRIAETNAFVSSGHKSPESLLCTLLGVARADAIALLRLGKDMQAFADLDAACQEGLVSPTQAALVARGAHEVPSEEQRLLSCARTETLGRLAKLVNGMCASSSADDEAKRKKQQHDQRGLRVTQRANGGFDLTITLTPEEYGDFQSCYQWRYDHLLRATSKKRFNDDRRRCSVDAFMSIVFDANGLAAGDPSPWDRKRPPRQVMIVVDYEVLRRGYRKSGERCHIDGVGPIAADTAQQYLGEATVRFLVEQSRSVASITSTTRYVPADLYVAMLVRDVGCQAPGCEEDALPLDLDHREDFAQTHDTSEANLQRLCLWHHHNKSTEADKRVA